MAVLLWWKWWDSLEEISTLLIASCLVPLLQLLIQVCWQSVPGIQRLMNLFYMFRLQERFWMCGVCFKQQLLTLYIQCLLELVRVSEAICDVAWEFWYWKERKKSQESHHAHTSPWILLCTSLLFSTKVERGVWGHSQIPSILSIPPPRLYWTTKRYRVGSFGHHLPLNNIRK